MVHFYHVPYQDVGAMPMRTVWRLMGQVPHIQGLGTDEGESEPAETQEQQQDTLADILTKAKQVGVRGPKA